ncbi:MAG TPA: alpha/beta hydrolase [Acetobacteraceae bacterium]|jgi:pimeloyl-ACP methyl ester carboxylesterase|nr:alpha/beta hydrolase [Acetobacteraceae bacterium]
MNAITQIVPAMTLDPREEHVRIASPATGLSLFLRHLPPATADADAANRVVLYVHGGTFPSALSVAYRFDGLSWRDSLCAAGFHVWALDFHGFGNLSDAYPEMAAPAEAGPPLSRAEVASRQLEQAVRFICERHGIPRLSLIAHSWGCIVAGRFAGRCPRLVERMVWFGPIARRSAQGQHVDLPAWRLISLRDQWDRFTADVPAGELPVLSRQHFAAWGEAYLDCDPASRTRSPPAVKVPCGAFQDIYDAWAGELAFEPGLVRAPVAIIRGEWDGMCTDSDARGLFDGLSAVAARRDIKIGRATHLMHLETGRFALYREAETFLLACDTYGPKH